MSVLLEKLEALEARYNALTHRLSDPEVISNHAEYQKLAKSHSELSEVVAVYRRYKKVGEELAQAKQLLGEELDAEFRALVEEERRGLLEEQARLERELKRLLIPKDPNDDKNVIVEIRA